MNRIITAIALSIAFYGTSQTVIYTEDFQTGLPANYTIVDNDLETPDPSVADFADAWIALTDPDNPNDTIVGSTSYFSPVGRADRWLITPPITLGAFGNILSWEAKSHDASYLDGYNVYISVTDTDLTSFIDTLAMIALENADWTIREVNLSEAGYNNQTVHIAFVNRTYDGFKLYLDDIQMIIEDPVSIDQLALNKLSIYPNPSNGRLSIKGSDTPEVTVVNSTGAIVFKSNGSEFDLSWVDAGVYFIQVKTDEVSKAFRWIKN